MPLKYFKTTVLSFLSTTPGLVLVLAACELLDQRRPNALAFLLPTERNAAWGNEIDCHQDNHQAAFSLRMRKISWVTKIFLQ